VEELRKKIKHLRILVCILLFLTSFQSVFLYLISKGNIPSALIITKEIIIKENNNTSSPQVELEDEDGE